MDPIVPTDPNIVVAESPYVDELYSFLSDKDPAFANKKSPEAFLEDLQNEAYSAELYKFLSSKDKVFKDAVSFEKFSKDVKKKSYEALTPSGMDSTSGVGLSEPSAPEDPSREAISTEGRSDNLRTNELEPVDRRPADPALMEGIEEDIRQKSLVEDAEAAREQQANDLLISQQIAPSIDIDLQDDSIGGPDKIKILQDSYGAYGFTFQFIDGNQSVGSQRGIGGPNSVSIDTTPESVRVISPSGEAIVVNISSSGADEEIAALEEFITSQKGIKRERTADETFLDKAFRAQEMRRSAIRFRGGAKSHQMQSFEEDGRFYVSPTLFPNDPNNHYSAASTWMELDTDAAISEARRRGEIFEFDTEAEADEFAKGAWKGVSVVDQMKASFYELQGIDWMAQSRAEEEYFYARDKMIMAQELVPGQSYDTEMVRKFPELFIDNRARMDVKETAEELQADVDSLFPVAMSDEATQMRMDFDSHLQRSLQKKSSEAASLNRSAAKAEDDLQVLSLTEYGVRVEDLLDYEPVNFVDAERAYNILVGYNVAQTDRKFAAMKYEAAELYYDNKVDKSVSANILDGFDALFDEGSDNIHHGKAWKALVESHMGVSNFDTLEELAEYVAYHEGAQTPDQGRAMLDAGQSKTTAEANAAFSRDPIGYMGGIVIGSLAQSLPFGSKWVPAGILTGAVTGATVGGLVGSAAGPLGAFSGVLQGAKKGAQEGGRAAMSLVSYAMELGNGIIESGYKNGYDWGDADSALLALQDQAVWDEGINRGSTRGTVIGLSDYLMSFAAGRIIPGGGILAGAATRGARLTGQSLVIDPLVEGGTEAMAIYAAGDWTGSFENMMEVRAETLGGLGSNTSSLAMNQLVSARNATNIELSIRLADYDFFAKQNISDRRVLNWVDNMQRLGKIEPDAAQQIRQNIGLRRDARTELNILGRSSKVDNPSAVSRMMRLLSAKKILEGATNPALSRPKIKAINEAMAFLVDNPDSEIVNQVYRDAHGLTESTVDKILSDVSPKPKGYRIGNKFVTKQVYLDRLNRAKGKNISGFKVYNDPEVLRQTLERYVKIKKESPQAAKAADKGVDPTAKDVQESNEIEEATQDDVTAADIKEGEEGSIDGVRKEELIYLILDKQDKNEKLSEVEAQLAERWENDIAIVKAEAEKVVKEDQVEPGEGRLKGLRFQVQSAMRSVKKVFPEIKFIVHETAEAYRGAVGDNSRGTYDIATNTVHINLSNATGTTVSHEAFHALLITSLGNNNAEISAVVKEMLSAVMKKVPKSSKLHKDLTKFSESYSDKGQDIVNEEYLAELFGMLAEQYSEQSPEVKSLIERFFLQLAKLVGFNLKFSPDLTVRDKQLLSLLGSLSSKVATGTEITAEERASFRGGTTQGPEVGPDTTDGGPVTETETKEETDPQADDDTQAEPEEKAPKKKAPKKKAPKKTKGSSLDEATREAQLEEWRALDAEATRLIEEIENIESPKRLAAARKELKAIEEKIQASAFPLGYSGEVDLTQYPLMDGKKGVKGLWRLVTPLVKKGTSLYIEEGTPVYLDDNGIMREHGKDPYALVGINMGDSMLTPFNNKKVKPKKKAAPKKAAPKKAEKAAPVEEAVVEEAAPVEEGDVKRKKGESDKSYYGRVSAASKAKVARIKKEKREATDIEAAVAGVDPTELENEKYRRLKAMGTTVVLKTKELDSKKAALEAKQIQKGNKKKTEILAKENPNPTEQKLLDYWKAEADLEQSKKSLSDAKASLPQRKQLEDMPQSAGKVLYQDSDVLPKPSKKKTNSEVAQDLAEVAANFYGGDIITSNTITPEQEELITQVGTEESIAAYEDSGKSAADWYSTAIEAAMAVASVIHPSLNSKEEASKYEVFARENDPVAAANFAMRMALAITSQNLNVEANAKYANEQFDIFKETGSFDASREYGTKATSISSNLRLANIVYQKLGINKSEAFVLQEFTVAELEKAASKALGKKVKVSGLRNDTVNGASLFGPKIGQGFLQNLMGKFDPVTIDLWLRRTWGRWTGDVVGAGVQEERMARLLNGLKEAKKDTGVEVPVVMKKYRVVRKVRPSTGASYYTMSDKFISEIEENAGFRDEIAAFAKKLSTKGDVMYRLIKNEPMSDGLYKAFMSGEKTYGQTANELQRIKDKLSDKYKGYVSKEKAKGRTPLKKSEWVKAQNKKGGRVNSPDNKAISDRKPEWVKAATSITNDLKPIDIPSNQDRKVITRIIKDIKTRMAEQGYSVTNADVQALLWYPEKDIWAKLRGEEESNLKQSYDDQFIKIAEQKGLGKEARAAANEVTSRRSQQSVESNERGSDVEVRGRTDKADGLSQRLAPNGRPSNLNEEQYKIVRTSAFKKWFGDWENDPENSSKVVDENGEPMVMYHGTSLSAKADIEINGFDSSKGRKGLRGFSFMSEKGLTKAYDKGAVLDVFLNLKNPMDFEKNFEIRGEVIKKVSGKDIKEMTAPDWLEYTGEISRLFEKEATRLGYDGVFDVQQPESNVFKNTNIKYADGSNTTFDATSPSTRQQRVGDVVERYEFNPNGSLKNAELADELRRNLKRFGFDVKQFGTRMNDFHIVNPATGRRVDPKKIIKNSRADKLEEIQEREEFRAELEAQELEERILQIYEADERPYTGADFEANLSARKQDEVAKEIADDNGTMQDIISRARELNLRDASIMRALSLKFPNAKTSDITQAMEVYNGLFSAIPAEFGDVKGGMNVGLQLYRSIFRDLNQYAQGEKGKQGKTKYRTRGEVRAMAANLMQESPVFEMQDKATREKLLLAMDRSLGTRANTDVSRIMARLRQNIASRAEGEASLKQTLSDMRILINNSLPKGVYTKAEVARLNKILAETNEDNFLAQSMKLLKKIDAKKKEIKAALLKSIAKEVIKYAKKRMSGGKVRSRAIDAGGQAFFEALRPLATAVAKGEWAEVDRLRNELNSDPDVDAAIDKQARGQELTTKEQRLVDRAEAMDMLGDAENMSLEEVMAIMEDLKLTAGFSNISLKNTRLRRAAFRAAKNREAASALRARYPSLTHDDGTPLNDDELQTLQDAVRHVWRGGKGKGLSANVKGKIEASKMFMSNFNLSEGKRFILSMFNGVKHLGTYLNKLDPYLYDNIYNQLNRMGSKSLKGYFEQTDLLDDIANSIGSNTKGYKGLQEKLFVEDMLALPNATDIKGNRMRNVQINKDQALRIYALYKNQEQRNKLVKQGFDADVIAEIETFIGPDLKEFADKIVEYLSNEYFESINSVYAGVNDVNLPQIEDYFPTITLSPNIGKDLLIDGDFGGIFNAETSPALKLRTDTTSSVSILADFSSVLDNHFKQMERYKAYAAGVRDMSDLFRDNTVNALFNSLGTKRVIKGLINNAINPDSGKNALTGSDNKLMEKIQTMFTKMVLAFKPMQFIKQSTSLVTSIADYSYRGPGRMNLAIDLPMYMVDLAWTLANFRTVYKQAKAISPEFRYRVAMGVKGDVVGLYGGSKTYKAAEMMRTKKGGAVRAFQQAGSSFTTAGDIVGVMGYMVNYRRDIINGMDQQAALEKFEDYNQTQQSRRPTDKNSFQQNPTAITRAFTMFGSTNFLYMNNVMMSGTNILRDISDGKRPAKKDIRKFVMNLGLANAAFVFMSNIFKYMQGDDEDRETVYGDMVRSALGLSVLYQIPFFAAPVKNFDTWLTGKRHFTSTALNPLERISREFIKAVKGKEYDDALQTLAEIGLQTNIDPAIAMKDIVKDGEFDQQSMYKILGVSKSYQPGN